MFKIGMAKPAARRLLDIIKKKRRKSMVTKLLPGKLGTLTKKRPIPGSSFYYTTAGNVTGIFTTHAYRIKSKFILKIYNNKLD